MRNDVRSKINHEKNQRYQMYDVVREKEREKYNRAVYSTRIIQKHDILKE